MGFSYGKYLTEISLFGLTLNSSSRWLIPEKFDENNIFNFSLISSVMTVVPAHSRATLAAS